MFARAGKVGCPGGVTFYLFDTGQSWGGALPYAPALMTALLFGSGVFITDRVNKMPMVLVCVGV